MKIMIADQSNECLRFDEPMVLHIITISEGGDREILYLRPLAEYSKGGDTGRTDKSVPTRDPSSECLYSDEFDKLILEAVQGKYPDAKPSPCELISCMGSVEKVVSTYKRRLLKYVNNWVKYVEPEVPQAFVCFRPFDDDLPLYSKEILPSVSLDVVYALSTEAIESDERLSLMCDLVQLETIEAICKKARCVSFVQWFRSYYGSVEMKYSEE